MFLSSHTVGNWVRTIGLAAALTGAWLVTAPHASAQSANDMIHSLAPTEHAPEQAPPPAEPGSGRSYHAPSRDYHAPRPYDAPRPYYHRGPRVEDTDVYLEGRRSRAYVDYSRAIDLTVYFEFNSAEVTDRARDVLDRLGQALNSAELRPYRFLVAGHTDAVGDDESNLELSYHRAEAVREYLAAVHGVPRWRLAVRGWGRSRLKDPYNPESGINRRVEVALIVDRGSLEGPRYAQDDEYSRGARPWLTCPPGSRLIDPAAPDADIDDFAAGSPAPMCRPLDH